MESTVKIDRNLVLVTDMGRGPRIREYSGSFINSLKIPLSRVKYINRD